MSPIRDITKIAVLSTLGLCLMLAFEVPLFPSAPFLKYDAGDIAVLIGAFALGPMVGVSVALLKCAIYLLLRGTPEAFVGAPMNFLAGASFAWCAGSVYFLKKTKPRAILSLFAGGAFSSLVMLGANLLVLPLFMRTFFPEAPPVTTQLLLQVIVPFNLLKASITGVLVFVVYKRISPILKAAQWELPARARPALPESP